MLLLDKTKIIGLTIYVYHFVAKLFMTNTASSNKSFTTNYNNVSKGPGQNHTQTQKSLKLINKSQSKRTMTNLTNLIKELELAYNLSSELSKKDQETISLLLANIIK